MVIGIVLNIAFWICLPNTYLKDGMYITTKPGIIYPLHIIMPYYMTKLFLTRYGFFTSSSNRCIVAIGVICGLEIAFRLLGYIRAAHLVTMWWCLGLASICLTLVSYVLDNLLYEVKFEVATKNK